MAGWQVQIQRALGRGLKLAHRSGGFRVTYKQVRDATTDPHTTSNLTVYVQPTPLVKQRELVGNRWREVLAAGGNLSAEALPVFVISREYLKVSGTYYDPTLFDEFVKFGTTTPVFRVYQTTALGGEAPGWFLSTRVIFREYLPG